MGRLDGKVALITGAARGMGESHARLFIAEGARVMFGDVRDDLGTKVAAELGEESCRYVHHDVTSEADWANAVATAVETFGKLNVLVNNAGVLKFARIADMPLADFRQVMEVNTTGCWLGMKAVIEPMKAAGGGSIVNIASVAGAKGTSGLFAYTATKWAVRGMTKAAALELARYGIRVNAILPGVIETPMVAGASQRMTDAMLKSTPLRRTGQPTEIAAAALYLASADSAFVTGVDMTVDGGMSL